MDNRIDLTEGNIFSTLTKLALPIMGTSFLQMAYNLTDMMWLGRLSTNAVAAAGAVGILIWFGMGLVLISQIGVGVGVAQSYGKNDMEEAKKYISNGFQLDIFIGILYSLFLYIFRYKIIGFLNLDDPEVFSMAIDYLVIIAIGIIFHFINPIFSATLNSSGNSVTPFKINSIGLVANMILDPLLIFGLGPIPGFGVKGAAVATIMAQFIVTLVFYLIGKTNNTLYSHVKIFQLPDMKYIKRIAKLGFPAFVQTGIHAGIGLVLTRIVASFGAVAVAVQTVGSQIESISWMTSEGFSAAISAFIGQNFGAEKYDRIKEGYKKGMQIVGTIGIFATLLLVFAAEPLFKIFIPDDPIALQEGIHYLRILGLCQFFMTIEIGTAGAFNGLGNTMPPAITGVVFNLLRAPLALLLSGIAVLGLKGVWWSISISSVMKGSVAVIWFNYFLKGILNKRKPGEII